MSTGNLRLSVGPATSMTEVSRSAVTTTHRIPQEHPWIRLAAVAAAGATGLAVYWWYRTCSSGAAQDNARDADDDNLFEIPSEHQPFSSQSAPAVTNFKNLDSPDDEDVNAARLAKVQQIVDLLPSFGIFDNSSAPQEKEESDDGYETDLELEWNMANEMEEVIRDQLLQLAQELSDVDGTDGNAEVKQPKKKRRGAKQLSSKERDAKFLQLAKDYMETCQERTKLKRRMMQTGIWDDSNVNYEASGSGEALWGGDKGASGASQYYDRDDDEDEDVDHGDDGGNTMHKQLMRGVYGDVDHEMPWDEGDDDEDDEWEDDDNEDENEESEDEETEDGDAVAEMMAAYGIDPEMARNMNDDEMEEMMQFMFEKELMDSVDQLQQKATRRGYEAPKDRVTSTKESSQRGAMSLVEEIDDDDDNVEVVAEEVKYEDDDQWETDSDDVKRSSQKSHSKVSRAKPKSKTHHSRQAANGAAAHRGDTWIDL
mmetsp:Transcript_39760/g.46282  ORF Transcript_39760/g.46282 Transcript_39760/m.46282 type:complete len:483 (-) Transcript_39760:40-1488(-)